MIISNEAERARTLRVAAQLLSYPDEMLIDRLPLLTAVAAQTGRAASDLIAFCDILTATPLRDAQTAYVDTFDLQRRSCLYLTYYSHGDTRKRGMALLRFTHAYKAAGFEVTGGELPDHLGVVCEFAAAEPREGRRLFAEHRAGVELLRMALSDAGSSYLHVIDAVRSTLPAASAKELDRALQLAQSGPPAEEVGLEPFAPPEYMGGRR